MMHIEYYTFNAFQTRCSVVWDDDKFCALVDPGCASTEETSALVDFIASRGLKPVCIMLTHCHFDTSTECLLSLRNSADFLYICIRTKSIQWLKPIHMYAECTDSRCRT